MHIQLYRACLFTCFSLFSFLTPAIAQNNRFSNFIVKEHLLKNNKLAIIACDSAENPLEEIHGEYDFVLNGFDETLDFHNGVAITQHAINRSTFVFIKNQGKERSIGKLY